MPKSPREVRREIQDAVTEQVRDLPIHAVRLAMFGVGRALLLSDRVTRDYKELRESGVGPVLERLRGDARHLSGQVVGKVVERVNGSNGSVETVERDTPVATPPRRTEPTEISVGKPATPKPERATPKPKPVQREPEAVQPKPEPVKTEPGPVKDDAADLPVPDYDTATLASVRARLRALSAAQVSKLRAYEQAHANRPEFVRMFDNRIAKLTQQA